MCAGEGTPMQIQQRRHHVDAARHVVHDTSAKPLKWRTDDERHANDALVNEDAVRSLAVIAKAFAVIADDDDDGAGRGGARCSQEVEDAAGLGIHEGDLGVVGPTCVQRAVRLGRLIGSVRRRRSAARRKTGTTRPARASSGPRRPLHLRDAEVRRGTSCCAEERSKSSR